MSFIYIWCIFLVISFYGKSFRSFVYVIIYCAGAGISTLMSISDGLDAYLFLSIDGKDTVYDRRNERRGFYFPPESAFNMIELLFPICTLKRRVNNFVSLQRKGKVGETKVLLIFYKFVAFGIVFIFWKR